ncbi:MAG: S9 family peptidase [Alphaproteobacteria bacterium]|nr:S9 family peptidase [Alphaproteobacteria bacterium]MBU1513379.1 S9 family peptidase [Alphaproteobacteria bacterium]MBU2096371.1 S9 family peptidase [Alphaproteobacteria bacterium]MBU2149937.1 S9 family peptidase [Alphaproteobacteria bacterium]MBU2309865.1 S9 family peptidase [Alphaproteobacteria bacterium]
MTRFLIGLAALLVVALPAAAAPLEAYGKLPSMEDATVSPSGHAVAMVVTNGEQRTIVVQDLASDTITLRGFIGEHKIRNVQWAGDNHLVLVASATLNDFDIDNGWREWYFGSSINLKTKKLKPLMQNAKADLSAIFDTPIVRSYRGEPSVFVQGIVFNDSRGQLSLFRIDMESGANRLVQVGSEDTIDWAVDSEGRPLAQEVMNQGSGVWSIRVRAGEGWREAVRITAPMDRPRMIGLGRDNASVVYAAADKDGQWMLHEVRTDGAPPAAPIPMGETSDAIRAALDGRLIGRYGLAGDEDRYTFYDPADERAWKAIAAAYPGQRVTLQSWSTDRKKIVVLVDSPADGPAFALVNLSTREAKWLGRQYEGLKPADISPRTPIRFKAADGLALTGYLTLPQGKTAKGLPLVVFPHGGPAARDEPGFDWWAQAMASRGYAVLQVNFRGSEGLGDPLMEAGYGEWGRKMQTDLSDGVRHLAALGTIDPKRVCIVGASYGGYAALAGATLDRDVYRCAVSVAGVSDLRRLVAYSRTRGGTSAKRYWNRFMGADGGNDHVLTDYSPAQQAAKADIPILLIHGKDDTVVPLEQSRVMADALKKAGKPVDFVVQNGADHWLSRGDTRLETLMSTMAFVEKHNPPN